MTKGTYVYHHICACLPRDYEELKNIKDEIYIIMRKQSMTGTSNDDDGIDNDRSKDYNKYNFNNDDYMILLLLVLLHQPIPNSY